MTLAQFAGTFGLPAERISAALTALEVEGFALAGNFTPGESDREWCERRLLARIHRYTVKRLRAEIEPVSARDYLRFLFDWQGVSADTRREGAKALDAVIEQLAGFAAPAVAWEGSILSARLSDYASGLLDDGCLAGRIAWGRLGTPPAKPKSNGRRFAPLKSTPITLFPRKAATVWSRPPADEPPHISGRATKVAAFIARERRLFLRRDRRWHAPPPHASGGSAGRACRRRTSGLGQLRRASRAARSSPPSKAAAEQLASNKRRKMGAGQAQDGERRIKNRDAERVEQIALDTPSPLRRRVHADVGARGCLGCQNGANCCASIASSRRAARSEADVSSRAFPASSSRCPKPWHRCVRSGAARPTTVFLGLWRRSA